ncbi:MAG TPA: DUF2935 domain-containing protein [Planctomycetota bacterium]|nr:DUF2935 domain-containing protein [Planctomycetota bacterium]
MESSKGHSVSRRTMLAVGLGTAGLGAAALGPSFHSTPQEFPEPRSAMDRADRPWVLPDSKDPALISTAENRFWLEVLRDHADFFTMLMPGDALSDPRKEAQNFRRTFDKRLKKLGSDTLKKDSYVEFNNDSIEEGKRFIEWKLEMRDQQASGRMHSLVWPSFFQAASHEADSFVTRLMRLNRGEPHIVRKELADLWLGDAGDHAAMLAHFMDPGEVRIIHDLMEAAKKFQSVRGAESAAQSGSSSMDPVHKAAGERHEMEAAIQKAVAERRVQSIIHPLMTDHMVREGLRFLEDLKFAV